MDSGLNLVEHLLLGKLLEIRNLNFDLYYSSNKKVGEPPTKLGGQIKLKKFIPESKKHVQYQSEIWGYNIAT